MKGLIVAGGPWSPPLAGRAASWARQILRTNGADTMSVAFADYVFDRENPHSPRSRCSRRRNRYAEDGLGGKLTRSSGGS